MNFGDLGPGALSGNLTLSNLTFLGLCLAVCFTEYLLIGGALGSQTLIYIFRVQGLGFRDLGTLNTKSDLLNKNSVNYGCRAKNQTQSSKTQLSSAQVADVDRVAVDSNHLQLRRGSARSQSPKYHPSLRI